MKILGNLIDIHRRDIYKACITIRDSKIIGIEKRNHEVDTFIIPGLIDSHIHIESSMITPGAFATEAVKHGTVAVVSDPHEIANVCGIEGVDFMIKDGKSVPMKFYFGAPSCVPATEFETNGGVIDGKKVKELLYRDEILYLSEMMNFPGVIYGDTEVLGKLNSAKMTGKPVDGHAPGLSGEALKKYVNSGISTDHECSTLEEAEEKIGLGMKILIREGSAAKNMDNLKLLLKSHPDMVMLCSDDLHPEMLVRGHINKLISTLINEGFDIFNVLRSATINPVQHYRLDSGLLREGDNADFILVDNLHEMEIKETWINGEKVFGENKTYFEPDKTNIINRFNCSHIGKDEILIKNIGSKFRVIRAYDGELLTDQIIASSGTANTLESDLANDYLKIIVKDRYKDSPPQTGFIKGFNLQRGAFASSVAHDSHNIICVGTNDNDIVAAINSVVDMKGGLAVSSGRDLNCLQLNIGGIMTSDSCSDTALKYNKLNEIVKSYGCTMSAPFMTLAFMALLVIPELKIGDKGLFDVNAFALVPLFV
jgi:adenine deaminase